MEDFYQDIGIVFSPSSRNRYIEEAKNKNLLYRFKGSTKKISWIQEEFAYLAVNGVASLLRRLNLKFDVINEDEINYEGLKNYSMLFIPNAQYLTEDFIASICKWLNKNKSLLVSGKTNLPNNLLGISSKEFYCPCGYTGIRLNKMILAPEDINIPDYYITSSKGYSLNLIKADSGVKILGELYEFQGDVSNFLSAYKKDLSSPAIVLKDNVAYFTQQVFEYFAGLLQSQGSPLEIMGWNNDRYRFLDTFGAVIKRVIDLVIPEQLSDIRLKAWGKYDGVMLFRHDTDACFNTKYLDFERENNIPATYPILIDKNLKSWLNQTKNSELFEPALHYNTTKRFTRDFKAYKPAISGKGLYKQIKDAYRYRKLKSYTAHRHGHSIYYPETIDAMDYLFDHNKTILGLCTMFRFSVFRYGLEIINNERSYAIKPPDVSVPFWYPYKMVISSVENYKFLKGWDITSLFEPDRFQLESVLNDIDSQAKDSTLRLENGVYPIIFHPWCADKINRDGRSNWDNFLFALDLAKKHNLWLCNFKMLYKKLNDWESILMRVTRDGLLLYNCGSEIINNIQLFKRNNIRLDESCGVSRCRVEENLINIDYIKPRERLALRFL